MIQLFKSYVDGFKSSITIICTFRRGFTDDELQEMIRSGQRMELHYGHWFDDVIVNADLSTAFEQLLTISRRLEEQPQWVPISWVV